MWCAFLRILSMCLFWMCCACRCWTHGYFLTVRVFWVIQLLMCNGWYLVPAARRTCLLVCIWKNPNSLETWIRRYFTLEITIVCDDFTANLCFHLITDFFTISFINLQLLHFMNSHNEMRCVVTPVIWINKSVPSIVCRCVVVNISICQEFWCILINDCFKFPYPFAMKYHIDAFLQQGALHSILDIINCIIDGIHLESVFT